MGNLKFDEKNYYYSGQGVVMLGNRDSVTGNPTGLKRVGNCKDLKITVATTVITHKGSQDGQRAIDARLQTETNATISMTIDNWDSENIAKASRGDKKTITAGTVAGELVNAFIGKVSGFKHISVNTVTVSLGGTALTEYVDAVTPYDYKLNEDAGSILLNDPTKTGLAFGHLTGSGVAATAIAVGTNTVITVTPPTGSKIGDHVTLSGFAGANAEAVNGVTAKITALTGTSITVGLNTAGLTITAGTNSVSFDDIPIVLTVGYNFANQFLVDGLTQPLTDNWVRFEGLNTVDENKPVIVDLFRFSNDPFKELALLSDTFGEFVLEGSLLTDNTRPSGQSKYFQVRKLN
jgi:hypothetical protein